MGRDMKRQIGQAIGQFIVIVASGLMVYDAPESVSQLLQWSWKPVLQGIVAVGAIFGISKMGIKTGMTSTNIKTVK